MQREYPIGPVVAVGAVVVKGDRVLLAKRGSEPALNRWSLPGGAVELGETIREAVAREVMEETGLEVQIGDVLTVVDRISQEADGRIRYHYVIIDFAARWVSGEARPASDAAGLKWILPEEVEDPVIAELAMKAVGIVRCQ